MAGRLRLHTRLLLCLLVLVVLLQGTSNANPAARYLSEEKFLSYEPATTVTDAAALDLDMRDLIAELAKETHQGRDNAKKIYSEGSYSKSYARLLLDGTSGLPVDLAKGAELLGETGDGRQVLGKTLKDAKRGATTIDFQYHASSVQAHWTDCHVGGNPNPNLNGCLAPRGGIEVGELGTFSYTYNPRENNYNARSLQTLSTKSEEKMFVCDDGCPYPTYLKMHEYYGIVDYGNRWIMAAFNKTNAGYVQSDANFGIYFGGKEEGANEAILKGAVVLNVWMYVNRELQHAQELCVAAMGCNEAENDCSNEGMLHAWDKAVAFYTGSEPKSTGNGGYLLYSLAQKRCRNFGTCLTTVKDKGTARVNSEIFKAFRQGQQDLVMNNCGQVAFNVKRITELMTIPLIQGTLRYAYHHDNPPLHNLNQAKTEAEGATYAAAILPFVDACSKTDAKTIYENMRVGNGGTTDFQVVKSALERNYDCLGVTCADVGGLVDVVQEGAYMPGAEPCGISTTPPESSTTTNSANSGISTPKNTVKGDGANVPLAIGLTVGLVFVFAIVAAVASKKRTTNQEWQHGAAPFTEAEMT